MHTALCTTTGNKTQIIDFPASSILTQLQKTPTYPRDKFLKLFRGFVERRLSVTRFYQISINVLHGNHFKSRNIVTYKFTEYILPNCRLSMPKMFGYFIATILGQENLVSAVFWYCPYYNDKNSLMGFIISRKNWRKFTQGCQLFTEICRDFKSSDLLRNVF